MKVIVAGLSKTGTKSMKAALTELGYNVYDFMENYEHLSKEWEKICLEGGNTEDFYKMFKNVDAVTDIPGCYFWDEIHKAFPDSKIILTMRSNEDEWRKSMLNQVRANSRPLIWFLKLLSPTSRRMLNFSNMLMAATFGTTQTYNLYSPAHINMTLMMMTYRRHNSHVMQAAPKDKFLVYNVKEGWEPLCKFLNVDVPDKPFPHKNVRGNIIDDVIKNHPLSNRAKTELIFSISCIVLLLAIGLFYLGAAFFSD